MSEKRRTFESECCTRCGGGGHYSYCPGYGTRCFKCGGSGLQLTRRGRAAQAHYHELLEKPASEIQVGWYVWDHGSPMPGVVPGKRGWKRVIDIGPTRSCSVSRDADGIEVRRYYTLIQTTGTGQNVFPESKLRAVRDQAELDRLRAAAFEYEDSLTKTGTVRKRKGVRV